MGKGKKKETPYSLYAKEFKKKVDCSYAEAYELAAAGWTKLTDREKQKYVDMANRLKPTAVPSALEKATKDEDDKKHAMKEDIITTINLSHDRVFEHNFFLIHISPYFYVTSEAKYYPAEVCLGRFNLQDGMQTVEEITRKGEREIKPLVYHAFCNPGKLPIGYAGEVIKTAHKLPYPGRDDGEQLETSTEKEIFDKIVSCLRQGLLQNQPLPPIYTTKKIKAEVDAIVSTWLKQFGYPDDYLKVYELDELFYQLNLASIRIRQEKSNKKIDKINGTAHAELLISKDYFDYTPGIACEFHELSDVVNQCSKSFVIRWIYLVCSFCCNKEDLVPIQHMPKHAQVRSVDEACGSS